ncbi:MAG: 16S rRNA (cytosine(967)-C(5))-methyltransferase RsmB [Clostridia bacterium]|nr:16S rRNA (cytosine(967)-C(5))-methyltransferase RsmB [Clostridia bacterium]
MSKSARQAALTVLERCRRNQSYSDAMLSSVLDSAMTGAKDRALTSKLCYGVLQNMVLLDYYIDWFAESKKIEPKVRDILRISAYQLIFLDRIPAHAAVSEGVELCKKSGFSRAAGFVNAVLRKLAENREKLPEIPADNKAKYLSIKYSVPVPLAELFISEFGWDFTEQLLIANNAEVPVTVQVNTLKTTPEELCHSLNKCGMSYSVSTMLEDCLVVDSGSVTNLPEFEAGMFYVQDCAARLSVLAAATKSGDNVLDACAAPGGKSFAAAIAMKNIGSILSCDLHENKLKLISEGAGRLGLTVISCEEMDATSPKKELLGQFDLVIADVPCSGLGVIRKKPDIRYKDIAKTEELPKLQLKILEGVSGCVKPGGTLLYSTCTILKRENEIVVESFLAAHSEFSAEGFELPGIGAVPGGMVTLFPHIHGTDGFFICKLRRNDD